MKVFIRFEQRKGEPLFFLFQGFINITRYL
jgi:hypothetical protein